MPPIYVSDAAMTDPGDAPYVPNLQRSLHMNFNASIDAPNNNAAITSLVFRGSAPLLDRTFDKVRGTNTTFPVSVSDTEKYLRFAGANTLANSNQEGTPTNPTNPYQTLSNNFTMAFRVRVDAWDYVSANGVFRGVAGRFPLLAMNGSTGAFRIGGGPNTGPVIYSQIATGINSSEWAVITIVYDDTNGCRYMAGDGVSTEFAMPAGSQIQNFGFGANVATTGTAAKFDMSHFAIWDRSLSVVEMSAVRDVWSSGSDIQA